MTTKKLNEQPSFDEIIRQESTPSIPDVDMFDTISQEKKHNKIVSVSLGAAIALLVCFVGYGIYSIVTSDQPTHTTVIKTTATTPTPQTTAQPQQATSSARKTPVLDIVPPEQRQDSTVADLRGGNTKNTATLSNGTTYKFNNWQFPSEHDSQYVSVVNRDDFVFLDSLNKDSASVSVYVFRDITRSRLFEDTTVAPFNIPGAVAAGQATIELAGTSQPVIIIVDTDMSGIMLVAPQEVLDSIKGDIQLSR